MFRIQFYIVNKCI